MYQGSNKHERPRGLRRLVIWLFSLISLSAYSAVELLLITKKQRNAKKIENKGIKIESKLPSGISDRVNLLMDTIKREGSGGNQKGLIYQFIIEEVITYLGFTRCAIFSKSGEFFKVEKVCGNSWGGQSDLLEGIGKYFPLPLRLFDAKSRGFFTFNKIPADTFSDSAVFGVSGTKGEAFILNGDDGVSQSTPIDSLMGAVARNLSSAGIPIFDKKGAISGVLAVGFTKKTREQLEKDLETLSVFGELASALMDFQNNESSIDKILHRFLISRLESMQLSFEREKLDNERIKADLIAKEAIITRQWTELSQARSDIHESMRRLEVKSSEIETLSGQQFFLEQETRNLQDQQLRTSQMLKDIEASAFERQILFSILRHSYGNMLARVKTERLGVGSVMRILDIDITNSDLESRLLLHKIVPELDSEKIDFLLDGFLKNFLIAADTSSHPNFEIRDHLFQYIEANDELLGEKFKQVMGVKGFEIVDLLKRITLRKLHDEMVRRITDMEHDQAYLEEYLGRFLIKLVNDEPEGKGSTRISHVCNELIHKCKKYYKIEYRETVHFEYIPICNDDIHILIPLDQPTFIIDIFNNFLRNFLTQGLTQDPGFARGTLLEQDIKALLELEPELESSIERIFKKTENPRDPTTAMYVPTAVFDSLLESNVVVATQEVLGHHIHDSLGQMLDRIKSFCSKFRYTLTPSKVIWTIQSSLKLYQKNYNIYDANLIIDACFVEIFELELKTSRQLGFTKNLGSGVSNAIARVLSRLYREKKQFWLTLDFDRENSKTQLRFYDNNGGIKDDLVLEKSRISPLIDKELFAHLFEDSGKKFISLKHPVDETMQLVDVFKLGSESTRHALKTSVAEAKSRKEAIFDGFLSTSTDDQIDRHGKGLLSVKKILQSVGGTVNECGIFGQGVEFNIELPAVIQTENDEEKSVSKEKVMPIPEASSEFLFRMSQCTDKRILVVEDNKTISQRMKILLEQTGDISVDVARDLNQAMSHFSQFQYDLISLDLDLHASYGLDLLYYLKSNNHFAHNTLVPVVIVSTHISESFATSIMEEFPMVVGYLSKPWDDLRFIDTLLKVLETTSIDKAAQAK